MEIVCKRCCSSFSRKDHLADHLRYRVCDVNEGGTDVLPSVLLNELYPTKTLPCRKSCGKFFKTYKTRLHHELNVCLNKDHEQPVIVNICKKIYPFCATETFLTSSHDFLSIMNSFDDGILDFIKLTFFNKNSPHGHNIRKLRNDDQLMQFFDGSYWKKASCSECLDFMFNHIGKSYSLAMHLNIGEGLMRYCDVEELKTKVGIPLGFQLDQIDKEMYDEGIHGPLRTRLNNRIIELIYNESQLLSKQAHSVDMITGDCMCIMCRKDFENKCSPGYEFDIDDKHTCQACTY